MMNPNKVYFAPMMAQDFGLGFQDKRNRNPNWTDHEIIRFLEILQEESVLKDLMAQRNKQVFLYVAHRMTAEGSEKTWDQCRIKLKNLKSQYRYVKDRIPNIDEIDLDDDEVLKQLIAECQGRGISPSNIKHLRYLRRFLNKTSDAAQGQLQNALKVRSEVIGGPSSSVSLSLSTPGATASPGTSSQKPQVVRTIRVARTLEQNVEPEANFNFDESDSVSPPSTPAASGVRIIHDRDEEDEESEEPVSKRKKCDESPLSDLTELLSGSTADGYKFIEKFNREMMEQFMEYQRRYSQSYIRFEQERQRQEQLALEQWRQEAREHEKQMFGIFCGAISHCNAALNIMLKAKSDAEDKAKKTASTPSNGSSDQDQPDVEASD